MTRCLVTRIALGMLVLAALLPGAQVQAVPNAGHWYPDDPAELNALLDSVFKTAEKRAGATPRRPGLRAIVAPHAALQYSGMVAAAAYRLIGKPKNVIVLGFSHRGLVQGVAAAGLDAYSTPIGEVRVNREAIEALRVPKLDGDPIADHSLGNQLPFLRRAAPDARIIPLYVGELKSEELAAMAKKLAARVRAGDLLVASSDFTHYGENFGYTPFPHDDKLRGKLYQLSMLSVEEIGTLQPKAFEDYLARSGDTICGRDPIRLLMATMAELDEDIYLSLADYLTSGDLTGDFSSSVGYGALAFYPASAYRVSEADQKKLLASARATLNQFIDDGVKVAIRVPPDERSPAIRLRTGVFVTFRQDGQTRGCVGILTPSKALFETVADRTVAAATDARYKPLTAKDGPVKIEISVLTPMKKILGWEQYKLGYGAVLVFRDKGGILLPQLAAEYGWNARQFLEGLSRKAGLPPDTYKRPEARLYVYQAQVFAEPSPKPATANGAAEGSAEKLP